MITKKINITNLLTQDEKDRIFKYSKKISQCYNLCLQDLRTNCNFKNIHNITKIFQNNNLQIYSKHAQNVGRDAINAVKSFFKLRKTDSDAKFPKNKRKYSPIILDANKQKTKLKNGQININLGGGFKFINSKKLKLSYPQVNCIDLSNIKYFNENQININTIKQIVITTAYPGLIFMSFVINTKNQIKNTNNEFISIDLGVASIASIYSTKGQCLKYQTKRFKSLQKIKDNLKSKRDTKIKYSRRWKKLNKSYHKKQNKITNSRKDYLHKASKHIINYCLKNNIDNIIIGDIKTKKIAKKNQKLKDNKEITEALKNAKNKSTQNEGLLSRFKNLISYKAQKYGLNIFLVNQAYTSQKNCLTGRKNLSSDLSKRIVQLQKDFIVDRDLNSAVNIAKKYRVLWSGHSFNKYNLLNVIKINSNELD